MFAVSMPNSATRSPWVETATKCLATAETSSLPRPANSQRFAAVALVRVSRVENVLDATMKSVVSGSRVVELSDQIDRVDVGDEPDADSGVGVMP